MAKRQWNEETKSYQCQYQLLPMSYGLNKSYSKKIYVGLENLQNGSQEFKPIVRITGEDTVGIPFTIDNWKDLQKSFEKIDEFFGHQGDDLLDTCVTGLGYTIRFTISYSDKAIELVDNTNKSDSGKKYQRSLTFKKNTYDSLKIISKCVNHRIEYLNDVACMIPYLISTISEEVQSVLDNEEESQITYYTSNNIMRVMIDDDALNEKIVDKTEKIVNDIKINVKKNDIYILILEFIAFHMYVIVSSINT